jgi:ornithine cyclodeaminase/alanine dehydrogenase-like protein (mu-crystallin family)
MIVHDDRATAALLPYRRLVPALRQAVLDRYAGRIHAPQRVTLPLPDGGAYLAMPASDDRFAITKLVSVTPANRARGLPTLHATVVAADAGTGRTLCALDGPTVTARRTAAVTMLGAETLLGRPPRRVALVGTGAQAWAHALAIHEYWSPEVISVVGRTPDAGRAFARGLRDDGIPIAASELAPALADAECVVCLTTSATPVLPPAVRPDVLVVGVGAFTPAMAELPGALVRARTVVVDDLAGARHEAGDLIQAGVDWREVRELAEYVALVHQARASAGFVFKTVGNAAWDLAAVHAALAHSVEDRRT